ncbi:hypothetical protein [Deinococcus roseus]|uniref:Uncharacterized protein n=1 Tax=Deinococcus roseus TaxID=392414 RepID=A0ABQ2D5W6_9DEIO|nr:hypothetical protein [Deinococcus roseus]GGJ44955.1 hypothetical protein GCM10008938_33980 [Deinococcus roseus]
MTNHFQAIGFPIFSQEDFIKLAQMTHQKGQQIQTTQGKYIFWNVGSGIELWGQLDQNNVFIGLNPHFSGRSRLSMGLTRKVTSDPQDLDGAYYAWAGAQTGPEDGEYPLLFDCPDFLVHARMMLPSIHRVQVAAFAHDLKVYTNEKHYQEARESGPAFATESFIPSGLFGDREQPYGMFTGTVQYAFTITNPVTQETFHHAVVKTLGGEYDVIIHPDLLYSDLQPGNIVQGNFWLTGKILGNQIIL